MKHWCQFSVVNQAITATCLQAAHPCTYRQFMTMKVLTK